MTIDARTEHDPSRAPELVAQAIQACGTQAEVAARAGVSREYLRLLASGEKANMSYAMQVLLEALARE